MVTKTWLSLGIHRNKFCCPFWYTGRSNNVCKAAKQSMSPATVKSRIWRLATGVLALTYHPGASAVGGTGDSEGRYTCLAHLPLSPASGQCRQTLWPTRSEQRRWREQGGTKRETNRTFKKKMTNARRGWGLQEGRQKTEKKKKIILRSHMVSTRTLHLKRITSHIHHPILNKSHPY